MTPRLIGNLNAWLHLRAALTDLCLGPVEPSSAPHRGGLGTLDLVSDLGPRTRRRHRLTIRGVHKNMHARVWRYITHPVCVESLRLFDVGVWIAICLFVMAIETFSRC
jgi:hypothetical protein